MANKYLFPAVITKLLLASVATSMAWAAFVSSRVIRADKLFRENTVESLQRCAEVAPGFAECHALLAEHLESLMIDPGPEFRKALELNPADSWLLLRESFRAEMGGKYTHAERLLLEAARVNAGFAPRWALTSFYFRRGDRSNFWNWAKKSMAMSYGARRPLFRIMWEAADGKDVVIRQNTTLTPAEARAYLSYLIDEHPESSSVLALSVSAIATVEDANLLVDYCERMLDNDGVSARAVWDRLGQRGLLPYPLADPAKELITNGDFAAVPLGKGFDWRFQNCGGISVDTGGASELTIRFDGREAESCDIAAQRVPLTGGGRYLLSYRYQADAASSGDHPYQGVRWWTGDVTAGPASFETGAGWKTNEQEFVAVRTGNELLTLRYQRAAGTRNPEGAMRFSHIRLKRVS